MSLFLLIVSVVCSELPAKEKNKTMLNPLNTKNEPERIVLEGVPRIGWGEGTPIGSVTTFPMALWACMKYLGEEYPVEYIFSASGAAFRLLWKPGWSPDNLVFEFMAEETSEPIGRAFEVVGYTYEWIRREEDRDNEAYFRHRIIESIRDRGRPVLVCGIIGPPEWCIVTGYDEYGEVMIGWNYYQDSPGVEWEPSGYFRKRDWFTEDTEGLILMGEKQEKPPLSDIYRSTLALALDVVRTPRVRERHSGLAAYKIWAEELLRDELFPEDDSRMLGGRLMCHDDNMNVVAEGRWCAAQFLKQMAKNEPSRLEEIRAAAACYEAEYDLICQGWELMGEDYPSNPRSAAQARKLADPAIRRQLVPIILQAHDKDAEAADHIERVLAKNH